VLEREFNDLYAVYSRRIFNYILWFLGSRHAADDVFQTVFIKIWNGCDMPADPAGVTPWLYTVARNACLDQIRRQKRFTRLRADFSVAHERRTMPDPDDHYVWENLSTLQPDDRGILYLHFKAGFSHREIGSLYGMTENNVRVKTFRALRSLRGFYKGRP